MAATQLSAIIGRFDASPAAGDVVGTGGLWFGEVPADKTAPPCVVLWHDGQTPEYDSESGIVEVDDYRFVVFHYQLSLAEAIAKKIKQFFDLPGTTDVNAAMQVQGGRLIENTRTRYVASTHPEWRTSANKPVYQVEIVYRMKCRKTLGEG